MYHLCGAPSPNTFRKKMMRKWELESLQQRQMFATIVVTGTGSADTISVAPNPDLVHIDVKVNGVTTQYTNATALSISGGGGSDLITVAASINLDAVISGSSGNDTITGGSGDDTITGGTGNDEIAGYVGNDNISAGDGDDYVTGSSGADTIYGGLGADYLRGGTQNNLIYQNDVSNTDDSAVDRETAQTPGVTTFYTQDGDWIPSYE